MIRAYTSAASGWRRRNRPWSLKGPIMRGSTGSKITHIPSRFVVQPTTTPSNGSSHQFGMKCVITATGIPSRNPNRKPKLTISRSSRAPKSLKILLTSAGFFSKWSITISLGSISWSMYSPVASMIVCMICGSCCCTRAYTASLRARRHVGPQPGLFAAHHPVDDLGQPRVEHHHHLLGDLARARAPGTAPTACRSSRSPCRPRCCPSSPRAPARSPATRSPPA